MKMAKCLVFFLLLVLFVGAVSASEDVNDTISIDDNGQNSIDDTLSVDNDNIIKEEDEIAKEDPQISVSTISGTQGKTLTLKATVKGENGSIQGATVNFKFNGKTYTAKTNADGVATYALKFPTSKALKTTSKTKGSILTKTTTYQSTYKCDVTVSGDEINNASASFNVISKKASTVKKYKIIKTKKTVTLPVKNGLKVYNRGSYKIGTYKYKSGYYNRLETAVGNKNGDVIGFSIKHHYKLDGKWRWEKWSTYKKGQYNEFSYTSDVKCDKIMVKYTQVSYKLIK